MKAMILAAGLGTRLRPLTEEIPKALIPVNGRPLIHYQIAFLKKFGIMDIAINLHHLGDLIEKELGYGSRFGVSIQYSTEEKILGTGGGIKKMALYFGNEAFWVLNSDILSEVDLAQVAEEHQKKGAKATMVLRRHPIQFGEAARPTALFIDKDSRIISYANSNEVENRRHDNPLMFTGIHLIHPSLLEYLPEGFSCIFQDAYRPAIEKKEGIFGYTYDGLWRDLGTLDRYQQVDRELREGRVKLSY